MGAIWWVLEGNRSRNSRRKSLPGHMHSLPPWESTTTCPTSAGLTMEYNQSCDKLAGLASNNALGSGTNDRRTSCSAAGGDIDNPRGTDSATKIVVLLELSARTTTSGTRQASDVDIEYHWNGLGGTAIPSARAPPTSPIDSPAVPLSKLL